MTLMKLLSSCSVLLLSACSVEDASTRPCTNMWCQEGLTISFSPPLRDPGRYTIALVADGQTLRCEASLPFKHCDTRARCNDSSIVLMEAGCALPANEHAFMGLTMRTIPRDVELTVEHERAGIGAWAARITPQCGYPNGAACDQRQCCSAVISAQLAWQEASP